jgi:hypothetical protein
MNCSFDLNQTHAANNQPEIANHYRRRRTQKTSPARHKRLKLPGSGTTIPPAVTPPNPEIVALFNALSLK